MKSINRSRLDGHEIPVVMGIDQIDQIDKISRLSSVLKVRTSIEGKRAKDELSELYAAIIAVFDTREEA